MNKGQVLNEAIIAMGLITLTVIGSFGFMAKAITYNRFISDQSTAVHLAAEGVEIAKNILDSQVILNPGHPVGYIWANVIQPMAAQGCHEVDYKSFSFGPTIIMTPNLDNFRYLSIDSSGAPKVYTFYMYPPLSGSGKQSVFKRSVCLTPIGSTEVSITSTVTYKAKNGLLNHIETTTSIFNWR